MSEKPTRVSLLWYAVARWIVEAVCLLVWRIEVHGREHVPARGAFVLSPCHRSNIDTMIAGCVVRRRVRFMGKDTMWKYRFFARLFTSLGGFPVERGTPDRVALRHCEDALRGGEPTVVFPEGTRRWGPVIENLYEGAVFVAARTGVPIVPVGIGGSEWAMRKGQKIIRPVKVVVVVGPPIPPPEPSPGGRISRKAIAVATEQLQAELQRLFDEALQRAGRPTRHQAPS